MNQNEEKIDNHRYIVVSPMPTKNGTVPEGTEIVMFRGVIYCNGTMLSAIYQKEIKDIILKTEEDLKKGKRSQYLKEFPWKPTAVY